MKRIIFPVILASTLRRRRCCSASHLDSLDSTASYCFWWTTTLHVAVALSTQFAFFQIIGSLVYTNRPMQWHAYRDLPLTAETTLERLEVFPPDIYILVA